MKTYAEARQEVISAPKLTFEAGKQKKERRLRILYVALGASIVMVVAGLVLVLVK